jgi:hypothetical protein
MRIFSLRWWDRVFKKSTLREVRLREIQEDYYKNEIYKMSYYDDTIKMSVEGYLTDENVTWDMVMFCLVVTYKRVNDFYRSKEDVLTMQESYTEMIKRVNEQ